MASDADDPEAAADRLEAALERIAQAAARGAMARLTRPRRRELKKLLRDSTD